MIYRHSILRFLLATGLLICLLPGVEMLLVQQHLSAIAGELDQAIDMQAQRDLVTRIQVVGDDDEPVTGGEIEFFYQSGKLAVRLSIDTEGYFDIDYDTLQSGTSYKISILSED